MGAYLSTPVTDKEVEEGEGPNLQYGVAAMQGWRRTMEDGADSSTAAGREFAGSWPVWRPLLGCCRTSSALTRRQHGPCSTQRIVLCDPRKHASSLQRKQISM